LIAVLVFMRLMLSPTLSSNRFLTRLFKLLFKFSRHFTFFQDYHNGFGPDQKQPQTDLGEGKTQLLPDLDPEGKFINSTRVRCGRSLQVFV